MSKKKPAPKKGAKPQRTVEQRLALLEKQHAAALSLQKETLEQLANALIRIDQLEAGQTFSHSGDATVSVEVVPLSMAERTDGRLAKAGLIAPMVVHPDQPAPSSWWNRWFRTR